MLAFSYLIDHLYYEQEKSKKREGN